MRTMRSAVVALLFAGVGLGGCGASRERAAEPPVLASQPQAAPTQGKFLLPDGTVDYDALRGQFGSPNQNLMMNPRATDVAKTPSVGSVTKGPGVLTFAAAQAAWLLSKRPGDTLYCGSACGGDGFLRRIVSIQPKGDKVIVNVVNGRVTDIVLQGWLHAEVPIEAVGDGQPPSTALRGTSTTPMGFPAPIAAEGGDHPAEGGSGSRSFGGETLISGSMHVTPHYVSNVTVDIAISFWHWTGPTVDLVKFEIDATPSLAMQAELSATQSASVSWSFWDHEFPFAAFPVGPVEVTPTLNLELSGSVTAQGTVSMQPSATVSDALKAGFIYTKGGGAKPIEGSHFTHTEAMKLSGEAGLAASVDFEAGLVFKIYDIAGPQVVASLELGAEAAVKKTETTSSSGPSTCKEELEGDFYLDLAGKVGVLLDVELFSYETNFTVADKTWYFPANKWTYEIPQKYSSCPAETDAGTPDAGADDAGTGDGGTLAGSDGGSSGGQCGGVTCGAGTCCSFVNPGTCTSNVGEVLGGPCKSDTDCNCGQSNTYAICFQGTCTQGCNTTSDCPTNQTCTPGGTNATSCNCPSGPGCCC